MEEARVNIVACDEPLEVMEPTNGAFDDPSASVTPELASVLSWWADAALAVGADEIDALFGEPLAKRIAVGRLIVDECGGDVRSSRLIEQRLDEVHLGVVGRVNIDRDGQALAVGEDHDLGPLSPLGLADAVAPFLEGENVPSAKPSRQSILPLLSSLRSRRAHALSSTPLPVHSTKRRQQVAYDGKRGGRSFQRAPLRSTHRTPSKQARGSAIGRPPLGLGLGLANKSAISRQCSSLSSGCNSLVLGSVLDPAKTRDRSVI